MYPEEWMEFDKDLAELERQQRVYDDTQQVRQTSGTTGERIRDAITENAPSWEDIKSLPGKIIDSPLNPNLLQELRKNLNHQDRTQLLRRHLTQRTQDMTCHKQGHQ